MQKHVFEFMGRRTELWTHPEPDHMARTIRGTGRFYELDVLLKCLEIHIPGTSVIDVGANIGNHTVFFGAVLGAPVYAFEPFEPNFQLLEMNLAANDLEEQVVASCCAVGEGLGVAAVLPGPANNRGTTRVSFGEGAVPVRSLDGIALRSPPGLLKIDVEGAELAVLRGSVGLIEAWLPDIMIEAGEPAAFRSVGTFLLDCGYVPRGRYAATATYLFSATDQQRRMRQILAA